MRNIPLYDGSSWDCRTQGKPNWSDIDNNRLVSKGQTELDKYAFNAYKKLGGEGYLAALRAGSGGLNNADGSRPTVRHSWDVDGFINGMLWAAGKYFKNPSLLTNGKRTAANIGYI